MMDKNTDFPQFRKLSNGKTFYRITDEMTFEEIQLMGAKCLKYRIIATQYPEKLKIMDMLAVQEPYELSTKEEFENYEDQ
jgi:hypothetical protein